MSLTIINRWSRHCSHACGEIDLKWRFTRWYWCYITLQFTGSNVVLWQSCMWFHV